MKELNLSFPPSRLFCLEGLSVKDLFDQTEFVWALFDRFSPFIKSFQPHQDLSLWPDVYFKNEKSIRIESGVSIAPGVTIEGPCLIKRGVEIRPGAYIRGETILCENVLIGHGSEVVRSLILNETKIPHLNYVGDSILGQGVNMGAGVKIANLRLNKTPIEISFEGQRFSTGRHKLGALIGDGVQVGCNAVINPGTIIFPGKTLLPLTSVRGVIC